MTGKKKKAETTQAVDFEEALNQLESIVRRLEQGGGPLETALEDYEQAIGLMKVCHKQLTVAERRIEILSGVDVDGNPIVEEVDEASELSAADGSQPRKSATVAARKKGAPKSPKSSSDGLF